MMDGEKRIVTFMGNAGRKTANIIYLGQFGMFKVDCSLEDSPIKVFKLFMDESKAQQYAEEFVWEKTNGNE